MRTEKGVFRAIKMAISRGKFQDAPENDTS
jgi:hypothetical protein